MMNTEPRIRSLLEGVPLTALLEATGHRPAAREGDCLFYRDVIADSGGKTTFEVNTQLGVWYDHVAKKGGDIIDFGRVYWLGLSDEEIAQRIYRLCGKEETQTPNTPSRSRRKRRPVIVPFYHTSHTLPLGSNTKITEWLKTVGLWELRREPLREVYYYLVDDKGKRKDFHAAGWPTENGGWEVRCRYYAGCVGSKGLTFLKGSSDRLILFFDLTDYLTWKCRNVHEDASILVVNRSEFLSAALARAKKYARAAAFLNDGSGVQALTSGAAAYLLKNGFTLTSAQPWGIT